MNKELQDLTWSYLPKEFKEEAKIHYLLPSEDELHHGFNCALAYFFGKHNLTSDAQGENEMETEKFKVGDKVIFKNTGKLKIVVNIAEDGRYAVTSPDGKSPYRVYESDLEPYINPEKVSRNLSQETANCHKQLENSLSDSATHANVATSAPNIATSSYNVATSAARLRLRVAAKIAVAIAPAWADTPGAGSLIAKCRELAIVSATVARALITECSKDTEGDDA